MPVSMATHTQKKNQNGSGVRKGFLRKQRVEKPVAVMRIISPAYFLRFTCLRLRLMFRMYKKKDKEHCGNA